MSFENIFSENSETVDGCGDKNQKKKVTLKCGFCKFETTSKRWLEAHGNSHSVGANAFTCPHNGCYYRTMNSGKLKRHLSTHDPNRTKDIPCPLCPKLFHAEDLMRSHLSLHTKERHLLQCEMCEYRAQTRSSLNTHRQKQHSLQPLDIRVRRAQLRKCEICGYQNWNPAHFRTHLRTHGEEKPFKCPVPGCSFSTKREYTLQMHERGHDPKTALRCKHPGCTFMTGNKWVLQCHVGTHNTEKKYSCSFAGCQHRTKVLQDMRAHEITVHNQERKRNFQCALCENSFLTLNSLKNHTRCHTKEKHFTCPFCPYSLYSKKQLYFHLARKHEEQLAEDPEILQSHSAKVKADIEAKRLSCEFENCDYKCWFRQGMDNHVETVHLGLRPFACSFKDCGMAFKTKGDLRGHEKTHDPRRERVHKCPICTNRSFYRPKHVKRHILSDHKGGNPYKCRYCRYVSLNAKDVLSHMESDHPSEFRAQMKTATVAIQRTELEYL